jgi:hypothetical protein
MEGEAEDFREEVDGVARLISFGPAPIGVFDEEALVCEHFEVLGGAFVEPKAPFLEQRSQGSHAGGADLLPGPGLGGRSPFCGPIASAFLRTVNSLPVPAVRIQAVGGHSLSSNGAG